MKAKIYISYKAGILDPQGKIVNEALNDIGVENIKSISIGKYIEMNFSGVSEKEAKKITDESCQKLLANPNTETYTFEIVEK